MCPVGSLTVCHGSAGAVLDGSALHCLTCVKQWHTRMEDPGETRYSSGLMTRPLRSFG